MTVPSIEPAGSPPPFPTTSNPTQPGESGLRGRNVTRPEPTNSSWTRTLVIGGLALTALTTIAGLFYALAHGEWVGVLSGISTGLLGAVAALTFFLEED